MCTGYVEPPIMKTKQCRKPSPFAGTLYGLFVCFVAKDCTNFRQIKPDPDASAKTFITLLMEGKGLGFRDRLHPPPAQKKEAYPTTAGPKP